MPAQVTWSQTANRQSNQQKKENITEKQLRQKCKLDHLLCLKPITEKGRAKQQDQNQFSPEIIWFSPPLPLTVRYK